ncbi:hypothetical protein EIN_058380 [Entamoeba invadens IP1]|uniref:hypothetical protein n=1 Tax=Entamoeba invadens IP1 TaxID=370355 RepID=UPI0002C3DD2E|nr:hypothetical protein EIN_058380 [Entamoeba invadens IP1]ELP93393.1 hypothetical protein EIN_058380 [Entamoeba invadens IP1]|eukprot:XP_004260164.1 hypothetical protein EIN_058380 [Entamoeba invadens IP1]
MSSPQIKVLILRSHIGGKKAWSDMAERANTLGHFSLSMEYLMDSTFTYSDLVRIMPDVIVCSDTAGAPGYFSVDETIALKRFLTKIPCRGILGTYACFYHTEGSMGSFRVFDNRQIAPLFGLDETMTFTSVKIGEDTIHEEKKGTALFNKLGDKHTILGYKSSKVPKGGSWVVDGKIVGAKDSVQLVASNDDHKSVVLLYKNEFYSALYISSMPEFGSTKNTPDVQLLYNSIVTLFECAKLKNLFTLCLKSISEHQKEIDANFLSTDFLEQFPNFVRDSIVSIILSKPNANLKMFNITRIDCSNTTLASPVRSVSI